VAHQSGALATKDLERVAVDTTVQSKAIAYPTDARLMYRALIKLVDLAKVSGVTLRQSYRRVAIIGGPPRLWTSEQRVAGYREAIAAAALNPDAVPVVSGNYTEASGYAAATQLLTGAKNKRPTAILCANDLMAVGVIRRCRELGLQIPKDISLTGFDDIPSAELLDPALSTVAQPARAMGEAAARLLIRAIGGTTEPPETTEFATAVCLRHSIAAPPSGASSRRAVVAG
jgi:LacI family transcriptional regulator